MISPDNISGTLHPMTVHFPIALILTSALLALIYIVRKHTPMLNSSIRLLTVLSAVSAWAAVVTGGLTPDYTGEINTVEGIHHIFAIITSIAITVSAFLYLLAGSDIAKKGYLLSWIAFSFLILSVVSVSVTGYFGGYIVYNLLI
jgi:hypothetical protein